MASVLCSVIQPTFVGLELLEPFNQATSLILGATTIRDSRGCLLIKEQLDCRAEKFVMRLCSMKKTQSLESYQSEVATLYLYDSRLLYQLKPSSRLCHYLSRELR